MMKSVSQHTFSNDPNDIVTEEKTSKLMIDRGCPILSLTNECVENVNKHVKIY